MEMLKKEPQKASLVQRLVGLRYPFLLMKMTDLPQADQYQKNRK